MSDFNADEMRKFIEDRKKVALENDGGFYGVPVNGTAFVLMLNHIENSVRSSATLGRDSTAININSARMAQEVIAEEGGSELDSVSFRRTAVAVQLDLIERGFRTQLTMPRTMDADFDITFYVSVP